mmetsp:Transcript_15188/g.35143  ORF Transcript_15188/g.35143 Transcript_15188/m.35143 type:complete len:293 (-) Transcript_15188:1540-2418(-)
MSGGGGCQSKMMLRAVLCTLALGMDTTGAFYAPGGLATGRRPIELKGTNDMHGGPPAEAAPTNEDGADAEPASCKSEQADVKRAVDSEVTEPKQLFGGTFSAAAAPPPPFSQPPNKSFDGTFSVAAAPASPAGEVSSPTASRAATRRAEIVASAPSLVLSRREEIIQRVRQGQWYVYNGQDQAGGHNPWQHGQDQGGYNPWQYGQDQGYNQWHNPWDAPYQGPGPGPGPGPGSGSGPEQGPSPLPPPTPRRPRLLPRQPPTPPQPPRQRPWSRPLSLEPPPTLPPTPPPRRP